MLRMIGRGKMTRRKSTSSACFEQELYDSRNARSALRTRVGIASICELAELMVAT